MEEDGDFLEFSWGKELRWGMVVLNEQYDVLWIFCLFSNFVHSMKLQSLKDSVTIYKNSLSGSRLRVKINLLQILYWVHR